MSKYKIMAVLFLILSQTVTAQQQYDAELLGYINSGAVVKDFSQPFFSDTINYYKTQSVYESSLHDLNNPLYFSSERNPQNTTEVFRAMSLYIPLFRGGPAWLHNEVIDGFKLNQNGDSTDNGVVTYTMLSGAVQTNMPGVRFYESFPNKIVPFKGEATIDKEAMEKDTTAGDGQRNDEKDSDKTDKQSSVRPSIPDNLQQSVRSGLVVARFFDNSWGVFQQHYSYDDFMYVRYDNQRYRVLYTLDPVLKFSKTYSKKWFIAFVATGGQLKFLPSHNAEIENNTVPYAIDSANAVVAFNLQECPTGWSEYEPAYGRFVRGIDKSSLAVDPDGKRMPGNSQEDDNKQHKHRAFMQVGAEPKRGSGGAKSSRAAGAHGNAPQYSERYETDALLRDSGSESRPKNVALLYCLKS